MTMPEVRRWFAFLSARLRHVRILNGDWTRAVTTGASQTLMVRQGKGPVGVFLDPPYSTEQNRTADLYACDDLDVATAVREWALARTDDPKCRIVVAGFEGPYGEPFLAAGWREVEWFKTGHLTGGYANIAGASQQGRERLWLSPSCLSAEAPATQLALFEDEDENPNGEN